MANRKVKAKITRLVSETVICVVDENNDVMDIHEIIDEHEYEVVNLKVISEIHKIGG